MVPDAGAADTDADGRGPRPGVTERETLASSRAQLSPPTGDRGQRAPGSPQEPLGAAAHHPEPAALPPAALAPTKVEAEGLGAWHRTAREAAGRSSPGTRSPR